MKVLFIGVWKDGSGWGNATQNYILALDSVGIEVVPRAIKLNDVEAEVPERILELEQNNERNCDACIQHILPHMMTYDSRVGVNVGVFDYETTNFRRTNWATYLNTMDQVWVPNNAMVQYTTDSYVNKPIHVVPHCTDISKYSQRYEPYPIPEVNDNFTFYTISTLMRRKNLPALIKAFHLEFQPHEPVKLMLKVSGARTHIVQQIKEMTMEIKRGLRLYPNLSDYNSEIIITQWMNNNEIMRLHQTGDCFVLPSYGEAWCIPGFDAMALGNPVILTREGGPKDYIRDNENGILVDCRLEPAFIRPEEVPIENIWTGHENWHAVDIDDLRKKMRMVYEDKALRTKLSNNGIDSSYDYHHNVIGKRMVSLIEQQISGEQ
jgi:glycosyltransferase involved in cell wall biosynthesis